MNQSWMRCSFFGNRSRCPYYYEGKMEECVATIGTQTIKAPAVGFTDNTFDKSKCGAELNVLFCSKCDKFELER